MTDGLTVRRQAGKRIVGWTLFSFALAVLVVPVAPSITGAVDVGLGVHP